MASSDSDDRAAHALVSQTSRPLRILHLRQPEIGGVQTIIDQYVANTPGLEHVVARTTMRQTRVTSIHTVGGETPCAAVQDAVLRRPPQLAVRSLVKMVRPDVVHAHSSFAGFFARTAPRLGVPIVYTPHCFAFERLNTSAAGRRMFRFLEAQLLRRTTVLAGASRREAWLAKELSGTHSVPVVEVPHAAATSRAAVRERGGAPLVVGCIGRLAPQKRPDLFHDLVRQARRDGLPARFVWIGDGDPDRRADLEGDDVFVTGWVAPSAVVGMIDQLDAVVHLADWEVGDPLVCIEAAARALPVAYRRVASSESNLVGKAFDGVLGGVEWIRSIDDLDTYRAASSASLAAADGFDVASQRSALTRVYDIATSGVVAATDE